MMTMQKTMLEIEDRLAVLSIHIPEILDKLETERIMEIMRTIKEVREDPNIDVLVIAGTEDMDMIKDANIQDKDKAQSSDMLKDNIFLMIESMKKPVSLITGKAQNGNGELTMLKEVLRGNICILMK